MTYAIVRHRFLDIEVIVKKTLVFTGIFAFFFGLFAFLAFLGTDALGQLLPRPLRLVILGCGAGIAALLSHRVHNLLVKVTDRYLFQKKLEFKEVLKRLSERIVTILDMRTLARTVVETLIETLRVESCALIFLDDLEKSYQVIESRGTPGSETSFSREDPFFRFLSERATTVNIEDQEPRGYPPFVQERLASLNARVGIPLLLQNQLLGALTLGKKKSDQEYSQEEIAYFPTLASQAAIALSNARLYQEAIQARKKIEEMQLELIHREKMTFVSDLVKGIAHEVFNPLLPVFHKIDDLEKEILLGLFELYKKYEGNLGEEFRAEYFQYLKALRDAIQTLKINTQHIHLVIDTLNKMQKEDKETIGPLDLKMFLKDSRALISMELHRDAREVPVTEDVPRGLPPAKGNPTLLTQVFVNLFKNAIDAMEAKREKQIIIRAAQDPERAGFLKIDFSDRGTGIPADILPRIFNFGFTTKGARGQGIGLNQCKLIIEKFGGTIDCSSVVGSGTTFSIRLPIWEEKR